MKPWEEKKWLETAIPLDWGLTLYEDYAKHIVNLIYSILFDKENKKRRNILIKIIANLRLAYDLGVPLRYSRHKSSYTNMFKNYGVGTRIVFEVIEKLLQEDIIAQRMKGFVHYNPKGDVDKNRQTRIWPTPNLIGIFEPIQPEDVVKEPPQLIQLKKRLTRAEKAAHKKPKQIDYDNTIDDILLMERQLVQHHNLLEKNRITLEIPTGTIFKKEKSIEQLNRIENQLAYSVWRKFSRTGIDVLCKVKTSNVVDKYSSVSKYLPVELPYTTITGDICVRLCYYWTIRSFTTTFDLGGRYYNSSWGGIGKEIRKHIKINFETICEPDFQGLHPNMIYHMNGMDFGEGDIYACGDAPRKLYKAALLVLINSRPTNDPYETVSGAFRKMKLHYSNKFPGCLKKKVLQPIIDDVFKTHNRIVKYFFSDIGLTLQNIDSNITYNILNYFIDRQIVCLPVHDSFIVQQRYREELVEVMRVKYRDQFGYNPVIT